MVTAVYEKSSLEGLDFLAKLPNGGAENLEIGLGQIEGDASDLVLTVELLNLGRAVFQLDVLHRRLLTLENEERKPPLMTEDTRVIGTGVETDIETLASVSVDDRAGFSDKVSHFRGPVVSPAHLIGDSRRENSDHITDLDIGCSGERFVCGFEQHSRHSADEFGCVL